MASGKLKEVRGRIASVTSTQQITRAMKMVAAAKLRKAQDKILAMRPYVDKLEEILQNITADKSGDIQIPYSEVREHKNVLILAITSNRGLCGGFNSSVIKRTHKVIKEKYSKCVVTVMTIGKKAENHFMHTDYFIKGTTLPRNLGELFNNLHYESVEEACQAIMHAFQEKQFDSVEMIYNQFKNASTQILIDEPLLPITKGNTQSEEPKMNTNYIFEPTKSEMLEDMIPIYIKTRFFRALLDSNAAEHGARMTAMDQATENASEMLQELRISYNRARQADITTELNEIVSGANALEAG